MKWAQQSVQYTLTPGSAIDCEYVWVHTYNLHVYIYFEISISVLCRLAGRSICARSPGPLSNHVCWRYGRPHCGRGVIYKMHSDSISNISEAGWKVHGLENYYLVVLPHGAASAPSTRTHFKRRIMIQSTDAMRWQAGALIYHLGSHPPVALLLLLARVLCPSRYSATGLMSASSQNMFPSH